MLGKEKAKVGRLRDIRQNAIRLFDAIMPEGTSITDNLNLRLLILQEGFEAVQIFDSYDLSVDDLRRRIRASREYMVENNADERSKILLVNTSLYQAPALLREKLQLIYSEVDGSVTRYIRLGRARRQYRVIREFTEVEKWKHMPDVPKIWRGNSRTSMLHMMPFFGLDSVSPYIPPPLRSKQVREMINNLPVVLKRFDERETAHLLLEEIERKYGNNLGCYCEPEQGKDLTQLKEENSPEELKVIFKAHEPYGSNMEFAKLRELIGVGDEVFQRYSTREFVSQAFKKILGINVSQMRL